jgi:hypothetical protein
MATAWRQWGRAAARRGRRRLAHGTASAWTSEWAAPWQRWPAHGAVSARTSVGGRARVGERPQDGDGLARSDIGMDLRATLCADLAAGDLGWPQELGGGRRRESSTHLF